MNFQITHYMNLLRQRSILILPVVYGFNPWLTTIFKKGSRIVSPSLSSSYLFGIKFHQLYLAIDIIGRLNKLHQNCFQNNTFQNALYIIEIIQKKNKSIVLHE